MENIKQEIQKPVGLNRKQQRALKRGLFGMIPASTIKVPKKSKITAMDILEDVVSAAFSKTSIEIIANKSREHSPDRVLANLNKLLTETVASLMIENAERIAWRLRSTRRLKFSVAFDFTSVLYYGVDKKGNPFVTGTKPERGTYYAFRFFVISITTNGTRFILYACPVTKETDGAIMHVETGIELLQKLGINISVLTLDREFYSADVINYLQEKHINFIIPVPQTDRFRREIAKRKQFPNKLPAIVRFWRIGNEYKREAETTLVILEEKDEKTNEVCTYGYVTNLPWDFYQDDPYILSNLYSKRWGIETAFRVEDKFDIYTTSRKGEVRYFFFVIGCLLYNFWVHINFCLQVSEFEKGRFRILLKVDELKLFLMIFLLKDKILKNQKIANLLMVAVGEGQILLHFCHFLARIEKDRSFTSRKSAANFS